MSQRHYDSAWVDLCVGAGKAITSLKLEIACPTVSFRRPLPLACPYKAGFLAPQWRHFEMGAFHDVVIQPRLGRGVGVPAF